MTTAAPEPSPPLPEVLPVFPLTGSLLLPGNFMPLNVFEPRYRNMVEDVTAAGRHIGMIQPFVPRQDNWRSPEEPEDDPDDPNARPELYRVGCAGRIERCEPQPDGRFVVLLKGISRFRIRQELPLLRGYRRVTPDYSAFAGDSAELSQAIDPAPLLQAVRSFSQAQGLTFDLDVLAALPGVSLLNGLAVALPFRPEEKQALLEAPTPAERAELLLALMSMGFNPSGPESFYAPPTLH